MNNLINTTQIRTVNYLKSFTAGKFRFISKCRGGFMAVVDARDFDNPRYMANPEGLLTAFKPGALHSIEFCPEGGDYYLTVFARVGKKIRLIDETILASLTVGIINQYWYNTDLMNQAQYQAVGAKSWADRAYATNIAGIDFSESLQQLEQLI